MTRHVRHTAAAIVASPALCTHAAGQPSTLDSRGDFSFNAVPIREAVRSVATILGVESEVDARVEGDVTMSLRGVRVRALLDAICESVYCTWRIDGTVLRLEPSAALPPTRGPSGRALLDAVNRAAAQQGFHGKRVSEIVKALVASAVQGCDVVLPKLLDVRLSVQVGRQPLFEAIRHVLGYAGTEVDFSVLGALVPDTGAVRDCRLEVVTRRAPGPGIYAVTPHGLVQLPVFGEKGATGDPRVRFNYRPGTLEAIPSADTVQSLVLSMPE